MLGCLQATLPLYDIEDFAIINQRKPKIHRLLARFLKQIPDEVCRRFVSQVSEHCERIQHIGPSASSFHVVPREPANRAALSSKTAYLSGAPFLLQSDRRLAARGRELRRNRQLSRIDRTRADTSFSAQLE